MNVVFLFSDEHSAFGTYVESICLYKEISNIRNKAHFRNNIVKVNPLTSRRRGNAGH